MRTPPSRKMLPLELGGGPVLCSLWTTALCSLCLNGHSCRYSRGGLESPDTLSPSRHLPCSRNALSPGQPYRWPGGLVSPSESRLGLYPSHRAALTAQRCCALSLQLSWATGLMPAPPTPAHPSPPITAAAPLMEVCGLGIMVTTELLGVRVASCPPTGLVAAEGYTGEFSILLGHGWETPPP